jgi:hypothetical protein
VLLLVLRLRLLFRTTHTAVNFVLALKPQQVEFLPQLVVNPRFPASRRRLLVVLLRLRLRLRPSGTRWLNCLVAQSPLVVVLQ